MDEVGIYVGFTALIFGIFNLIIGGYLYWQFVKQDRKTRKQ